jgi:ABC-type transporter Mla subunit MlaD
MTLLTDELSSRGQAAAVRLTEATSTVLGTMQGSVAGVGEQVRYLTASLEQASQALTDHRQAVSEVVSQTHNAARTIERASQSLGGAAGPMQDCVKSIDGSMRKLLEGASIVSGGVRQAEASIKTASESLEQIWKRHVGRFQSVDEELARTLQRITQALDGNITKVSEYVKTIDDNMGNAVGRFAESLEELDEVFEKYLSQLKM